MSEMDNVRTGRGPWLAVAGLVVLQTLVLSWFIWDFETVLVGGREIILDVQPVDPRSLFRGDYVILRYKGLSRFKLPNSVRDDSEIAEDFSTLRSGGNLGVVVAPGPDGDTWSFTKPSLKCRNNVSVFTTNDVCLMGTITRIGPGQGGRTASVQYGIENYFVPEGEGRKLEKAIAIKRLQVVVAVDQNGRGLIKGLLVDGKRVGREGLFQAD